MASESNTEFARNWREIGLVFLRLGATAYGGPAIMGIMQAELQEKRQLAAALLCSSSSQLFGIHIFEFKSLMP